jgi:hypothetical protein
MFRKMFGTLVVSTIALTSGCASIQGKWDLATVEPTAAQRDVEFRSLRLEKDGTFFAEATEGTGIRTTSGTYSYDNGVLHLKAHDGEAQTYDAELEGTGEVLRLANFWQGRRLNLKYERRSDQ